MISYTANPSPRPIYIPTAGFSLGVTPGLPAASFARGPMTIRRIQDAVADYFGLEHMDMVSSRRAREVARPRQIAMFLSKSLTPHSLPAIGRRFGGRDHTTVIYAIKQITRLCGIDGKMFDDVEYLREKLAA